MSHLYDLTTRFWGDLVDRSGRPLKTRFIIQPLMATLFAIRDGYKDAHAGREPYLWTICYRPDRRKEQILGGLRAVSRMLLLGVVMDAIYQFLVLKSFHPLQMAVVVVVLAVIPYLLVRGPFMRIVRWRIRRARPDQSQSPRYG